MQPPLPETVHALKPVPAPAENDDFDMFADSPPQSSNGAINLLGTLKVPSTQAAADSASDMSRITSKIGGQNAVAAERDDEEGTAPPEAPAAAC